MLGNPSPVRQARKAEKLMHGVASRFRDVTRRPFTRPPLLQRPQQPFAQPQPGAPECAPEFAAAQVSSRLRLHRPLRQARLAWGFSLVTVSIRSFVGGVLGGDATHC